MSKTHVPLDQIRDNPHQARLGIGDVEGLAETILKHGLRQLPEGRLLRDGHVVTGSLTTHTCREDGHWFLEDGPGSADTSVQLAAGHRRVEAVRLLNADDTVTDADLRSAGLVPGYVPIDLQRLSDEEMLDLLTVENAQREGLSPIEQARLIGELSGAGRSGEEIAGRFGKSASWVSNRKRMLDLPEKVQVAVHEGQISARQGQALAKSYQLQGEKPDLVDDAVFELQPSTLAEDARQGASSERIREKVQTLEDTIESMESMRPDDDDDFSPDVGTTHPDAVGPEYPPKKTVQTDDPDRDREEAEASDDGDDARTSAEDAAGVGDRGQGEELSQPIENVSGGEEGRDGEERSEPQRPADRDVSGDGAPATVPEGWEEFADFVVQWGQKTFPDATPDSVTSHLLEEARELDADPDAMDEAADCLLLLIQLADRQGKSLFEAARRKMQVNLERTWGEPEENGVVHHVEGRPKIGQVVPGQVGALLSAEGEDMWDDTVASAATIASLLVAHRVASARQEHWRTREIAEVV
jgi:ParB-like chromosome segregation protein Spo0J